MRCASSMAREMYSALIGWIVSSTTILTISAEAGERAENKAITKRHYSSNQTGGFGQRVHRSFASLRMTKARWLR